MSGVLGYELDLTKMSAKDRAHISKEVAFYKQIRPVIQYGEFSRLIDPNHGNRCAWQFVAPDQSEVVAFSFNLLAAAQPEFQQLKLTGLDAGKLYQNVETGEMIGGDAS